MPDFEHKGKFISLILQGQTDWHYGHTINYPAGTDVGEALKDLLGDRTTLGQKPSEEEMTRRAAIPFDIAGVQFNSYEDASSAIRRFGEVYNDKEFSGIEEAFEIFRELNAS